MDLMEDPTFKNKYQKCKLRVKLWESDFMEKYGRRPNKNDIKEADVSIREAYKMYWKLKTRALEETLMDITFSDDVQANISASSLSASTLGETQEKSKVTEPNIKNTENVNPVTTKKTDYEAVAVSDTANVEGVWGDHLNKVNEVMPQKKQSLLIGRSSSFQLSQKMFQSTSFTKRNPRKSLSMSKLKIKSDSDTTASSNSLTEHTASQNEDSCNTNKVLKPIFGDKMKVVQAENKVTMQPVSAIQQLISGHVTKVDRKLNSGWLERCSKQNNLEPLSYDHNRLSGTSDSGVESMESSIHSPNQIAPIRSPQIPVTDEEDFICNSDSEEERKHKRIRNQKRRSSDIESQVAKRPCMEDNAMTLTSQQATKIESLSDLTPMIVNHPVSNIINVVVGTQEPNEDVENQKETINEKTLIKSRRKSEDSQSPALLSDVNNIVTYTGQSNEDVGDKIITKTNLLVENTELDMELSTEKPRARRKARRRIKQESSDDSDLEYVDDEFKAKEVKPRKPRQTTRKSNKNLNAEELIASDEDLEKKEAKPTKPRQTTRKTKKGSNEVDPEKPTKTRKSRATTAGTRPPAKGGRKKTKLPEEEVEPEETIGSDIPIYGVETFDAVPRFALPRDGTRDLIHEFSRAVSISSSQLNEASDFSKSKTGLSDREKFEQKVAAGKVNENFVRINLKKKVFVRGKKTMTFQKHKKNQWKQRKKELSSGEGSLDLADLAEKNGLTCFKCGGIGHFSRQCTGMKSDDLLPLGEIEEVSDYPTLEEAEKMARQTARAAHATRLDRLPQAASGSYAVESVSPTMSEDIEESEEEKKEEFEDNNFDDILDGIDFSETMDGEVSTKPTLTGHKIPEHLLATLLRPEKGPVEPLYPARADNTLNETPSEVLEALRMFGHKNFRPGQEKAVMRILSGQSTLVTLSTGSGKSLCYQLPAYLYAKHSPCITLVVSPLVSLMDDQVTGVPNFLKAACLHTNQASKLREKVMDMVRQGEINILLVSPEAVVAGEKSTGFGALLRQLPPIAFACIDEAHCISQWSHNFRPSYLMICRVLREKLGVKTVLGLTATATKGTAESIVNHLNIHDGLEGIITDIPMPSNLTLTVSNDAIRDHALVALVKSERFKECDSIIVYCTRREECVRLAGLLRTSLQEPGNHAKPNEKVSTIAEAYHAGLSSYRRKVVQKAFMCGQTRIVIATVAFGMGINKPNIRAVIHFNMPSSFEGYVQEVGRAGRDGLPAHCHLFLDPREGGDKSELRRHIFANGIDRHMVRRLLQRVFVPCSCTKGADGRIRGRCSGHEVAIPVEDTVRALDIPQEMIATLLCYLELHPKRFITVLPSVYIMAKVSSYNGSRALKAAAQSSPPLAMAIALDLKKGISHDDSVMIEFPVVDVAAAIGWDSGVAKSHLKKLEWITTDSGASKRSVISVRFDTLGFRVRAPGDLSNAELDEALDMLANRASSQETSRLYQLEAIHSALTGVCEPSIKKCLDLTEGSINKSDALKKIIRSYFQSENPMADIDLKLENKLANEAQIAADVRSLISSYRDNNFTGRAVARIFHGIQSPNYPALAWGRCRFWRAHLAANFNLICQVATREIVASR